MKILYLSSTFYIIYLIRMKKPYCLSYDPISDSFPHYKILYPGTYSFNLNTKLLLYYVY